MMSDSSLKQQQATNQRNQSFFLLSHVESCKTRGRHSAYKLQVGADYSGIEWHNTEAFRDLVGDFKDMISLGSAVGIWSSFFKKILVKPKSVAIRHQQGFGIHLGPHPAHRSSLLKVTHKHILQLQAFVLEYSRQDDRIRREIQSLFTVKQLLAEMCGGSDYRSCPFTHPALWRFGKGRRWQISVSLRRSQTVNPRAHFWVYFWTQTEIKFISEALGHMLLSTH